jgi:hypothetical protein
VILILSYTSRRSATFVPGSKDEASYTETFPVALELAVHILFCCVLFETNAVSSAKLENILIGLTSMLGPGRHQNELWLVKDVERIAQRLKELENDRDALGVFFDTQRKDVEGKQEHAQRCRIYFANLSDDRSRDLEKARTRRKEA